MRVLNRGHEWLADHIKWVQYPGVRDDSAPRYRWRYAMPVEQRILIATVSGILLFLSLAALFVLLVLAWAFFSS